MVGRNTSCAATSTQKTGTNTEADGKKSVNQTRPTDNLLSSSGVTGIVFSSNTERRTSRRGERERKRERKQDIDVKHAAHNHTDKTKRRLERHYSYSDVTTDCDVRGRDLSDRFFPPPTVPADAVTHKLSNIRLSTWVSLKYPQK